MAMWEPHPLSQAQVQRTNQQIRALDRERLLHLKVTVCPSKYTSEQGRPEQCSSEGLCSQDVQSQLRIHWTLTFSAREESPQHSPTRLRALHLSGHQGGPQ